MYLAVCCYSLPCRLGRRRWQPATVTQILKDLQSQKFSTESLRKVQNFNSLNSWNGPRIPGWPDVQTILCTISIHVKKMMVLLILSYFFSKAKYGSTGIILWQTMSFIFLLNFLTKKFQFLICMHSSNRKLLKASRLANEKSCPKLSKTLFKNKDLVTLS